MEINHSFKGTNKIVGSSFSNLNQLGELVKQLIDENISYKDKEKVFEDIQLLWEDILIDLENIDALSEVYTIPSDLPNSDIRGDIEEAIRNFQNGCFLSSIVMCRRSYEGALLIHYKNLERKDPTKQLACKNCKNVVKDKVYFGIVELHKWAVEKQIVSEKFKDIGFLVPNLRTGGAHPSNFFPRDKEVANVVINTTLSLLKQIHTNKSDSPTIS